MRPEACLFLVLASCAAAADVPDPREPGEALDLLGHADVRRREEGAYRLSILGGTIPDALAGRDNALAFAEEDTASMRQGISGALEERDPHRKIWRAWHALRTGCLAREWSRVSGALATQGFRLIEIYEPHERAKFVRFLAQRNAWINEGGDRHDLFFWVQAARKDPDGPWRVREVYVGLRAAFEAPFKQLASSSRYPRGSVMDKFFRQPELQTLATVFPILEEVELTYGRIRDKDGEGTPAGFHVNAGFVMDGKEGGRSIYYTAESGLDPREFRRGKLGWDGFVPSDVLGPLTRRGSGFWGAGGLKPSDD
jgi:hypothetical protein